MRLLSTILGILTAATSLAEVPTPPPQMCVDERCTNSQAPPQSGAKKWHPGHYMLMQTGTAQAQRFENYDDDLANNPSLAGAQVRWYWADLERSQGQYDFSGVEAELAKLQSMGKRLWIQILDRGFNTSNHTDIIPGYMLTGAYGGGVVQTKTGYVAKLWMPEVMDRKIALMKALAARFDHEPYFEAITGAETALALEKPHPDGFSMEAYAGQLKREISAIAGDFARTNVLAYTNFGGEETLIDLIAHLHRNGAGAGGPDTLPPPHDETQGQQIFTGKMGGRDYRGLIPIGQSVQSPELGGKEGNWTPQELWREGVEDLGATHMSWVRKTSEPGTTWADIKAYLRSNPRINTACPASYASCNSN